MAEDNLGRVARRTTTVDLSWFLDLDKNKQLDLDPPYQRRSVWTPSDRRFFLDTIFRNYPSPAIFLHKSIDDDGEVTYHVVDGKQRISTILQFVSNRIYLPKDFGDERLNGKRWRHLEPALRRIFWNYPIPIEQIDVMQGPTINDVFARLNKNSRVLTRQELRHARFDGWLITFVENEAADEVWRLFKLRTAAKEKRMMDVQNISELFEVIYRKEVRGFDQFSIDELYGELDEADEDASGTDYERLQAEFVAVKDALRKMESHNGAVSQYAQPFVHLYSLWSFIALSSIARLTIEELATRYVSFMKMVAEYELSRDTPSGDNATELNAAQPAADEDVEQLIERQVEKGAAAVARYKIAALGASTERPQREARLAALRTLLG